MTPRRQQTLVTPEPSIRVYKIIAISFLLVAVVVLGLIGFISTKKAVITIESKAEPIDASGVVLVGESSATGTWQGFVTSTKVSYVGSASPTSGREEDAIATGSVTLHNETSAPQSLIPTTRLLSESGVLFRMKTRATVPANGTVLVDVYADKAGVSGNISPTKFIIPGLPAEKQSVIYATSDNPMTGGTKRIGMFTEDDRKQAEQNAHDQLLEQGKQILSSMVGDRAAVFTLQSPVVHIASTEGENTDQVSVNGTGTVIVVAYPKEAVQQFVNDILSKRAVDDTEIIEPSHDEPTVSIDDVDLVNHAAKLKIISSGTATLNPESQQLNKTLFFGKSKDEVRRYMLSLEHVHGVEVAFQPAWVMTVPSVADHVSVVVKRIE